MRIFLLILTLVVAETARSADIPELTRLQAGYDAKRAELMEGYGALRLDLNKRYAAALDKLHTQARKRGELDLVLAIRKVLQGYDNMADPADLAVVEEPVALNMLQTQVKAAALKERSALRDKQNQLNAAYKATLERLVRSLTARDRIDDALAVRKIMQGIDTGPVRPAGTSRPAPSTSGGTLARGAPRIPPTAKSYNGHYYQVYEEPEFIQWSSAKARCEFLGGHLVTIGDEKENRFLTPLIAGGSSYFLGASDAEREGEWAWVDGSPMDFTNWYKGQPDDSRMGEDFMVAVPRNWPRWLDADRAKGYICEWDSGMRMTVDPQRPLVRYSFDQLEGNWILDESGNGNDGRFVDGVGFASGVRRNAAVFANGSARVVLPEEWGQYPRGDFAISLWFKRGSKGTGSLCDINYAKGATTGRNCGMLLYFETNTKGDMADRLLFRFSNDPKGLQNFNDIQGPVVKKNTWVHVVAMRSGEQATLHVNGELVGSVDVGPERVRYKGDAYDDDAVLLGSRSSKERGNDRRLEEWRFDGAIDEFALYTRALTPAEIKAQANPKR